MLNPIDPPLLLSVLLSVDGEEPSFWGALDGWTKRNGLAVGIPPGFCRTGRDPLKLMAEPLVRVTLQPAEWVLFESTVMMGSGAVALELEVAVGTKAAAGITAVSSGGRIVCAADALACC